MFLISLAMRPAAAAPFRERAVMRFLKQFAAVKQRL